MNTRVASGIFIMVLGLASQVAAADESQPQTGKDLCTEVSRIFCLSILDDLLMETQGLSGPSSDCKKVDPKQAQPSTAGSDRSADQKVSTPCQG